MTDTFVIRMANYPAAGDTYGRLVLQIGREDVPIFMRRIGVEGSDYTAARFVVSYASARRVGIVKTRAGAALTQGSAKSPDNLIMFPHTTYPDLARMPMFSISPTLAMFDGDRLRVFWPEKQDRRPHAYRPRLSRKKVEYITEAAKNALVTTTQPTADEQVGQTVDVVMLGVPCAIPLKVAAQLIGAFAVKATYHD